ncbi:hypothetical protein CN425_18680 [Bacillus cereus]|uniref:Phage tail tape measure protein n=1 Tax=Bacillus cereus TaxID=1396 RepID=A0A2A8PT82_BACCE|nr:hypothetical protein [Bacillus cereus]PEV99795.1 hypothetical protein CN425_18680 [Bacillus cereus]
MASVIDIMIQAQDRASNTFRQTSAEAKKMAAIIGAITIGASAMTPALLGGLGAITALFGTAGIAAAGFGALAFSTFVKTTEKANDLEQAHLKANAALIAGDTKGYAKAMAMVQAIMESMSEEERQAVVAINNLKDAWTDMEDKMTPTNLRLIAESTNFLTNVMTRLFPSFQGVGESFVGMIAKMNEAITTGKADVFFEHMNTFAVPMFEKVMISAGNVLKGLGGIMVAFTPLGMQLGDGMVSLTQKFADWAWSLQSNPAFQDFVKQVQESTPIIMNLIGQIVLTLWDLVQGLYPVSIEVLKAAASFLEWSRESGALQLVIDLLSGALKFLLDNANWLLPVLASMFAALGALRVVHTITQFVGDFAKGLSTLARFLGLSRTATVLATASQWALNTAMLANPIGIVIGLVAALIAIGVALYLNWDDITKYLKKLWSDMKTKWNEIKNFVGDAYNKMVADAKKWWADTKQKWNDTVNEAKAKATQMKTDVVNKYNELVDGAKQKMLGLYNDGVAKWNQIKTDASNKVQSMKQTVIDKYNQMKADASNKLQSMVSDAQAKFDSMVQAARNKISSMKQAATDMLTGFKDSVVQGFNNSITAVYNGASNMVKQANQFIKTFYNSGKGLLSSFVDGIKSGFSNAVSAVSDGMSKVRSYLPFSPAKKGPLSDLDKSGEAFFPTWYEAALTQVKSMERAVGGAFSGVANEANVALAGTGLEALSNSKHMRVTVTHEHKHSGTVGVDGSELEAKINQTVVQTSNQAGSKFDVRSLVQTIKTY